MTFPNAPGYTLVKDPGLPGSTYFI